MKKQSGFTLIELLLVLAIIGIISAIAIPAILSQRENAKDKSAISNCTNIVGGFVAACETYTNNGGVITKGTLQSDVIGADAANSMIPEVHRAYNPWTSSELAYNTTIMDETDAAGTATFDAAAAKALGAGLGQVQFGFLDDDQLGAMIAAAVKVKKPISGGKANPIYTMVKVQGV